MRLRRKIARFAALSFAFALSACATGALNVARQPATTNQEDAAEMDKAAKLIAGHGVEKNVPAGVSLLKRVADRGNPAAQTILAEVYISGIAGKRQPSEVIALLEKAAQRGYASAEAQLAFLYLNSDLVPKDYGRAYGYATEASAKGNLDGDLALSRIYANGWGQPQSGAKALEVLKRGADQKYARTYMELASLYRDGKIVPADTVASYAWLELAVTAAKSNTDLTNATRARDQTVLLLLPEQISVAQRLARSWQPGKGLTALHATNQLSAPLKNPDRVITTQRGGPAQPAAVLDAPQVGKALFYDYDVHADGSYSLTIHRETTANNPTAAQQLGQLAIGYNNSLDRIEIQEAYTLKADGRKLPVDTTRTQVQLPANGVNAPMFSDQRQLIVIFPAVDVGDTIAFTARIDSQARFEKNFTTHYIFDPRRLERDVRITIRTPRAMQLRTEAYDVKFSRRISGDSTVHEWRWSNPNPVLEISEGLDAVDRLPRLFASSFKGYDDLAEAYWSLSQSKLRVTAEVQKLANRITSGTTNRREQADRIYRWVSRNIRYVLVVLGNNGAFIPHDVDTIIANGYGDCKDHSLLFAALLAAKGIDSEIVLINAGSSYALAGPPTFGSLNHAINWLPEFGLYADTTAGVAPFGTLPFDEYGKPVVHVASKGQTLRRTPIVKLSDASISVKTKGTMDDSGRVSGTSEVDAKGPFAVSLRMVAARIEAAGTEQAAATVLKTYGWAGTGRYQFRSPYDLAPSYQISGTFQTQPRRDLLSGNSFHPPLGLGLGWQPGDKLIGPLSLPDLAGAEATACFSGEEHEEVTLELPQGYTVRELPQGTILQTKFFRYSSAWTQNGRTIAVRRDMTAEVDQPLCVGDMRRTAAGALNRIRGDYNKAISLTKATSQANQSH